MTERVSPAEQRRSEAVIPAVRSTDLEQHAAELRARVPEGFTVVVSPPFVVVGDEPPSEVRRRAEHTVAWAVRHLKASYFDRDPDTIQDVWLFRDSTSYQHHTVWLTGAEPHTPYGFASEQHGLIMDISTGGGTLVHEIVHPYMRTNFPGVPAWFNEGLASLYEQCGEREGRIVGFTNWRLAGLQAAIRRGTLPSFRRLLSTTEREFYDADPGTNYAQARYLYLYLQEQELLRRYYRSFLAGHHADPTGLATLQEVLGVDDMADFQEDWESWVLTLRFP